MKINNRLVNLIYFLIVLIIEIIGYFIFDINLLSNSIFYLICIIGACIIPFISR